MSSSSKVAESLGIDAGSTFEVNANGKKTEITIDEDTTINSLVNQLKAAGVSADFDAGQQRFYIGANALGEEADFTIIGSDSEGTDALKKLGILYYGDNEKKAYEEYANMSAEDIASMKQSRVEARVAALTAERESLNKSNEELDKRVAECVEEYNKEYGQNGTYDLADESQRNSRKAFLDSEISRLEGLDSLSAEEQADLDKYKGEMSYVKGYEDLQKEIKTNTDRLVEISSSIDADGNATNALKSEVDVEVTAKIDEAKKIVNGWDSTYEGKGSASNKQVGQNAEIELNGVQYFSDSNTFDINGLTITCNGTTAENEVVTLSTKNDTSGIYDMIKGFIKEYSALINEMDKLYNAESAKGYEPLTDEEKEAMSESEIEKWESKIKDSLLRRDGTLNTVASAMKEIMMSGFEVNGKKMYLYDFGIETMGYFNAADNEKNAYHIYGDEDDEAFKNESNKLMAMISSDPDAVVGFFTQLSQKLYGKMFDLMKGTEYSSVYKVYEDKKMKEEYDDYTVKIAEAEKKLQAYEDKWYKKFASMETAMARMQSNASAVTALLGGS